MGKFAKHQAGTNHVPSSGGDVGDPVFREKFPALTEYLTLAKWENGKARKTSTLTLFVEDGLFKACLNDRDSMRVCFVTGSTFQGLLGELETNLAEDAADWRRAQGGKK